MTTKALVIPAAGSGKRVQRRQAKPFIKLGSQTILEHTLRRFTSLEGLKEVIVATSASYLREAEEILDTVFTEGQTSWQCIEGGAERQDSVYQGLQALPETDLILIHDAVRPLVNLKDIEACCKAATRSGAAILGVPCRNTIKKVNADEKVVATPARRYLRQVQTPQVFRSDLIVQAYKKAVKDNHAGTDDASLVERTGRPVQVVRGSQRNIKITYPQDLELARILLNQEQE